MLIEEQAVTHRPAAAENVAPFACILRSARENIGPLPTLAGPAIIQLITLSGRIPLLSAMASLQAWEQAVAQLILGREDIFFRSSPEDQQMVTDNLVEVRQSSIGHVSIRRLQEPGTGEHLIGYIELPESVVSAADASRVEDAWMEDSEQQVLDSWLARQQQAGTLAARVQEVLDHVNNVESTFVYIGDTLWARSDVGNTLQRSDQLTRLIDLPLAEWPRAARLFVAGFSALFKAGKAIRFEEFNGQQFSARGLAQWLRGRRYLYTAALGMTGTGPNCRDGPFEDAAAIAELRPRLEPSGIYGYRRINGLTLNKSEQLGRIEDLRLDQLRLPHAFRAIADELAVLISGQPAYQAAEAIAGACLKHSGDQREQLVQRYLAAVVTSAAEEAGADYAMSSGPRDLLPMFSPNAREMVMNLKKDDFFCCCLPSRTFTRSTPADSLINTLYNSSKRMQYNRWHFIAGNYDQVPLTRHFYFPPLMPDLTEWSDMRHGGHIQAAVRYAVRVPGPSLWRAPLTIGKTGFRGFFDIRLVRVAGAPFGLSAIAIAARHCLLIEAFWRTATRVVCTEPCVTGFGRDFYRSGTWQCFTDPEEPRPGPRR